MDTEPDFKALALAWVDGDARSAELKERDPDRREQLAARLAEALDRRRREVARQPFEGGNLIVRVPEDRMTSKGIDDDALNQLEDMIREHHKHYPD